MRRALPLSLLILATLANSARAAAIFALQWRDTGTSSLTILPGDDAAGGQRTLDVVMTLDTQWVGVGMTVVLPRGTPLGFDGAEAWDAPVVPGISWTSFGAPRRLPVHDPLYHLEAYQEAYWFVELPVLGEGPVGPPWVPAGTYRLGSVLVDTSAAHGTARIEAIFTPGLDGLIIDDGTGEWALSDDVTFLDASLGTAQLTVVPEPSSLGLVALGLLTIAAAGRRWRVTRGSVRIRERDAEWLRTGAC